jgi:hypothetical protein
MRRWLYEQSPIRDIAASCEMGCMVYVALNVIQISITGRLQTHSDGQI